MQGEIDAEVTLLDSPIEVMTLMHKAFRAVSDRMEAAAAQAQDGGDLTAFRDGFQFWMNQLLYHAATEDRFMTPPFASQG